LSKENYRRFIVMKKIIKKWLEKLEKANKESFGSGPLDCCELAHKAGPVNTNKKTSKSN